MVKGKGIGKKTVSGTARVIKVLEEADKHFKKGDILVTYSTNNDFLPYIKKASAIVVEERENGENSHAAIVGRTLDIPVIVAAENAVELIRTGTLITVESKNGLVYNGAPENK